MVYVTAAVGVLALAAMVYLAVLLLRDGDGR